MKVERVVSINSEVKVSIGREGEVNSVVMTRS